MNRKANGIVGVLIILVILGAFGFIGLTFLKGTPSAAITPTPVPNIGDIDRSGVADEADRMMVRSQMGCMKSQPCWNKTVGKTKDGDNPLYTFDLDLDKDGVITQKDLDLVK